MVIIFSKAVYILVTEIKGATFFLIDVFKCQHQIVFITLVGITLFIIHCGIPIG